MRAFTFICKVLVVHVAIVTGQLLPKANIESLPGSLNADASGISGSSSIQEQPGNMSPVINESVSGKLGSGGGIDFALAGPSAEATGTTSAYGSGYLAGYLAGYASRSAGKVQGSPSCGTGNERKIVIESESGQPIPERLRKALEASIKEQPFLQGSCKFIYQDLPGSSGGIQPVPLETLANLNTQASIDGCAAVCGKQVGYLPPPSSTSTGRNSGGFYPFGLPSQKTRVELIGRGNIPQGNFLGK